MLKTAGQENPKFRGKVIGVDHLSIQYKDNLISILEAEQNTTDIEIRYKDAKEKLKLLNAYKVHWLLWAQIPSKKAGCI